MLLLKELCLGIPSVKNVLRREILKKITEHKSTQNYWCVRFVLFMRLKQKLELSYLCLLSLLESRLISGGYFSFKSDFLDEMSAENWFSF